MARHRDTLGWRGGGLLFAFLFLAKALTLLWDSTTSRAYCGPVVGRYELPAVLASGLTLARPAQAYLVLRSAALHRNLVVAVSAADYASYGLGQPACFNLTAPQLRLPALPLPPCTNP